VRNGLNNNYNEIEQVILCHQLNKKVTIETD